MGTSGWRYSWNPDGLEWYVRKSGFNAVELNMSFYGFPRERQVERWARVGGSLRWVIKVHQSVTHLRKLSEKCLPVLARFRERFKPLENSIDLYLLQLPPSLSFTDRVWRRVIRIRDEVLGEKTAVEPRHPSWFSGEVEQLFNEERLVLVTPDSPMFGGLPEGRVFSPRGVVYVRMHGRTEWYAYRYSGEELEEVARKIVEAKPKRAYVFFNNNHDMLDNGREMMEILRRLVSEYL